MSKAQWSKVRLDELKANKPYALNGGPFGSNLGRADYRPEGVPVIRGGDISGDRMFSYNDLVFVSEEKANELRPNNAHPGDLIFTQRGTLGRVGMIPRNAPFPRFVISQSQMKLTVNENVADPHFLYCYFRAPSTIQTIHNLAFSSGVPHINLDILRNFEVLLPPLPTQRKIAAILSAYDDLIEVNTRRIALLEEMARGLYREWFVRFRFPGHEGVRMVESAVGAVPEGWEVKTLGDVVELAYGKGLKADTRKTGIVPVFGSAGVVGRHNASLVKGPGVIVGRKGNVGSIFWSDDDFFPIDTVFYVQTKLELYYVFYALHDQHFINSDAAVPGLSRNQAYLNPFLVPDHDTMSAFAEFVAPIFAQTRNLRQKNANLRRTSDLLLPRLVAGEVVVGGVA